MIKRQDGRSYVRCGQRVQTFTAAEDQLLIDMAMCGYTPRAIAQAVNVKFDRQRTRKQVQKRLVRLRPSEL